MDLGNYIIKLQSPVVLVLLSPRKFQVVDSLNHHCNCKFTYLNYHCVHYTTVCLSPVGSVNVREITLSFSKSYL